MRVTATKLLEFIRRFLCIKCNVIIKVLANYDMYYSIQLPKKCITENCNGKTFQDMGRYKSSNCKNYQEIKIQVIRNVIILCY